MTDAPQFDTFKDILEKTSPYAGRTVVLRSALVKTL
jgi:hypothetical protein